MEKQEKEAWETCVLDICQGRLTAIKKNKKHFSGLTQYMYIYCLSTMPFGCFWFRWLIQRPRLLRSRGASLWSSSLDPLLPANRWGARTGSHMGGFYGQAFHLFSIGQNSLTWFYLTSKEAGKHGLSVCLTRKEKRFDEQPVSLCCTFQRVLATRTRNIFEWVEHCGGST